MNIEQNKNIRERWISSLFELANFEYQKRLWNAEIENEVGDFTECVSKYFDDLDLDNGYASFVSDGIISEKMQILWRKCTPNLEIIRNVPKSGI